MSSYWLCPQLSHRNCRAIPLPSLWPFACTLSARKTPIWRRTALSLAIAGTLFALRYVPWERPATAIRLSRPLMGTLWTMEVCDDTRPAEARAAINAAYSELVRIDELMSEWKPNSPISQVNAAAGLRPVEVPAELRAMIERSIAYSKLTDGAFDITWRGMGKIWKFEDPFVTPTPKAVAAARRNVNYQAIQISGNRVFLPRAAMNIGLGGIAKGYAVDRAFAVLRDAGFNNFLVDGGGDVRVSGTRDGVPWRLGIQHPRRERGQLLGTVAPREQAVITSGDYERFRIVDGVRYHHIIDLRSGWPANAASAVTVLSPTAEQGVVLAKAIFILGPEAGLALARSQGLDALLIEPSGRRHGTAGFQHLLQQEEN